MRTWQIKRPENSTFRRSNVGERTKSTPDSRYGWMRNGGQVTLGGAMTGTEIVGGLLFGPIALVADWLRMSAYTGTLLLVASCKDARFAFGS